MYKLLNPRTLPVKSSELKNYRAEYIDVLVMHYCNADATICTPPIVDSDALASKWKDCILMMHRDHTDGLQGFCKLLVTTSQYVAQYSNLVKIALVTVFVPVTNVECERSFSCQNRINPLDAGRRLTDFAQTSYAAGSLLTDYTVYEHSG